ncbi:YbjQ family protein [Synoicihabitans lomoniglobus]|uniref:Heavy metal-binding domain-containing protein n=1 Tax=Synoicihabitans lomoniglobus TaxID=2909285 RepID=A0AAF0CNG7_9BACT|nr:YbjQ family protein [Opitutaceae bacterium LMO-M01]WED64400.1 heavy metal-binding domain-containing protein [Opitutaceae bacterium LMO-M01]
MDTTTTQGQLDLAFVLLFYALPLVGLVVFGGVGIITERRHYASIRQREQTGRRIPMVPVRTHDPDQVVVESRLVSASVVISLDYFKRFLASLRNIFGGRVRSYETLMDRARREVILRLQAQCPNADMVLNFRLETSSIANTRGKKGAGGVEVLAYGTMVRFAAPGTTPPPLH